MAFDLINGNLYFSDTTSNQRVRRIDYITGQINTIAGTGTAGYIGDGSSGTTAHINAPTGVGVDSQEPGLHRSVSLPGTKQVIT